MIALAALGSAGASAADFGRWRGTPQECVMEGAGLPRMRCHLVQLNQHTRRQFSIGFIGPAHDTPGTRRLVFVGLAPPGQDALACDQGHCRLDGRLRTGSVSTISRTEFDGRGLPVALPATWRVDGNCQILRDRIRCDGRSGDGRTWQASATL
jgi:hypothetical protein